PEHPEVVPETARLAELCEFDFEKRYFLPQFPRAPEFASDNDLLVHLARAGARARYGEPLPPAVEERLAYELGVISHTGYAGYFLIVSDITTAARARGIPVGPGRGSAAGSLVAYALGITDIDPIKFDLLFERFLNPERVTMPDIDLDFCFERRGEVIEYMRSRYGRESVGQIITCGTRQARAAFRDVARTLRLEMGDVDRLSKLIPSGPGYALTLAEAAEKVPDLRAAAAQDERVRKILQLGTRIEGLAGHAPAHAAGGVIAPGPLTDYLPVRLAPQEPDALITQFDMVGLEAVRDPCPGVDQMHQLRRGLRTGREPLRPIGDVVAGLSRAEADVLRRVVGKEHREMIQHELGRSVRRAVREGHVLSAIVDNAD